MRTMRSLTEALKMTLEEYTCEYVQAEGYNNRFNTNHRLGGLFREFLADGCTSLIKEHPDIVDRISGKRDKEVG